MPLPAATVARYERRGGGVGGKRIQPARLMLCHDFARGYPEWEAAVDGVVGEKCPPDKGMWRFNHWGYVDVFVYFSHFRVSPVPKGFTQAAHRHGALALGTIIFENDDGREDLRVILSSFRTRAKAANQLATMAKFFGFDGWLVNVEVALPSKQAAGDLLAFVADLTRATRKLVGPASEVVWYDAVTRTGELKWQNELNQENDPYFKAAGAMFTNYHWDRSAPVRSAVKAGPRRTDVFTGIDIYGRGTYGGGGLHTHLALRPIKQSGTSAALFAPAWTVDRCPPNATNADELEERFWTGPRGKFGRECIATYFKERPVVTEMPFATNFDPGWGPNTKKNGLVVDNRRYFNMCRQDIQPSFLRSVVASGDTASASLAMSSEIALQGSASVRLRYGFSATPMLSGTYSMLRLFVASVPLVPPRSRAAASVAPASVDGGRKSLRVAYDFYIDNANPDSADTFGIVLLLNSPATAVLLVSESSKWVAKSSDGNDADAGMTGLSGRLSSDIIPRNNGSVGSASNTNVTSTPRLQILGKYVSGTVVTPSQTFQIEGPPENESGKWYTRVFDLPPSLVVGQRLSDVLVVVGNPPTAQQSVSPSPFMTPSGSRSQSRIGSRRVSRSQSRQGSRASSRRNSPPLANELLTSLSNMTAEAGRQNSSLASYERNKSARPGGLPDKRLSRTHVDLFDGVDDMDMGQRLFSRSQSISDKQRRGMRGEEDIDGGSYANAFDVGGSVDFSDMESKESDAHWSNTSRAISRLSSRLGTPSGNRPTSMILSRLASRQGSTANSLAVSRATSRMGSRSGSRVASRRMSPAGTPRSSGGIPLMPAGSSLLRSGMSTPRTSGVAPLRDLKSALMQAAGSMAGSGGGGSRHDEHPGQSRVITDVYLGSLRLELYEISEGGQARNRDSAGMDNNFFDVNVGAMSAQARASTSGAESRPARPRKQPGLMAIGSYRTERRANKDQF